MEASRGEGRTRKEKFVELFRREEGTDVEVYRFGRRERQQKVDELLWILSVDGRRRYELT